MHYEEQIQHISGYKQNTIIVLHFLFMCLKYLRASIYNNLVQYMYPDMFAVKTISHSL